MWARLAGSNKRLTGNRCNMDRGSGWSVVLVSGGRVFGLKTKLTKDFRRRECVGMGFSRWARLAVSNKRLTKETFRGSG